MSGIEQPLAGNHAIPFDSPILVAIKILRASSAQATLRQDAGTVAGPAGVASHPTPQTYLPAAQLAATRKEGGSTQTAGLHARRSSKRHLLSFPTPSLPQPNLLTQPGFAQVKHLRTRTIQPCAGAAQQAVARVVVRTASPNPRRR